MDPLLNPSYSKQPIRETTLEEIRQGLLRDANRANISFKTAQHYRQLAELLQTRIDKANAA